MVCSGCSQIISSSVIFSLSLVVLFSLSLATVEYVILSFIAICFPRAVQFGRSLSTPPAISCSSSNISSIAISESSCLRLLSLAIKITNWYRKSQFIITSFVSAVTIANIDSICCTQYQQYHPEKSHQDWQCKTEI